MSYLTLGCFAPSHVIDLRLTPDFLQRCGASNRKTHKCKHFWCLICCKFNNCRISWYHNPNLFHVPSVLVKLQQVTFGWAVCGGGRSSSNWWRRDSWDQDSTKGDPDQKQDQIRSSKLTSRQFLLLLIYILCPRPELFPNRERWDLFPSGKWKEVKLECVNHIFLQLA